jgi:hypothetical protein
VIKEKEKHMAKITMIISPQDLTESAPRSFTQIGGIYGSEIRPEDYLTDADITQYTCEGEIEQVTHERNPRFFRVE